MYIYLKNLIYIIRQNKMNKIPKNQQELEEFLKKSEIITDDELNVKIVKFPTLWTLDKNKRLRYWIIYIGICNDKNHYIDVIPEYFTRKELPNGYYGIYWTISGVENTNKPIISEKKEIKEGSNKGRNNFTTPFTQALMEAKSEYEFKEKKGATMYKEELNSDEKLTFKQLLNKTFRGAKPWRVFVMLLHDANKNNNLKKHIKFPCFMQPKLDGTLFVILYHPDLPEIELHTTHGTKKVRMDGYSRGRETYEGQDHIFLELEKVLSKYPGIHLVGELWKKGYGLQDISGSSRRQLNSSIKTEALKLDYNVFDCFSIDKPDLTFKERIEILKEIFQELNTSEKYVKLVETEVVDDNNHLDRLYKNYLERGFEGAVVRDANSLYQFGINTEIRSYETLKLKPRPDAEWPVIGFTSGKGKESKLVIWTCCENDEGVKLRTGELLPLNDRLTFNVTPNQPNEIRKKILEMVQDSKFFKEHIYGQQLVVSYSILSKDYLPQQPKALYFKDTKIQSLFM